MTVKLQLIVASTTQDEHGVESPPRLPASSAQIPIVSSVPECRDGFHSIIRAHN